MWRVAATVVMGVFALDPVGASAADLDQTRRPFIASFGLRDGDQQWKVTVGEKAGGIRLAYASERQVFGELGNCFAAPIRRRSMVAFDAATGREQWRVPVEALQEGSYAEQFGSATSTVVVLGANQALRGLEPQTGKTRWTV